MTRHNLCPNPACGSNTTGWTSNTTFTRATDITGMPVSTGIRYTGNGFMQTPTGTPGGSIAGNTYTASVYVKNNSGIDSNNRTVYFAFTRSAGGDDFSQTFTKSFPNATVTRIDVTAVAPANALGFYLLIDAINGQSGTGFDISAVLYEAASAPVGTYFDGNTANATWDGTANNSTSTLEDVISGASPNGIAVGVALGTPSTSYTLATTPNGISVPVRLGNPRAGDAPVIANDGGGWYGLLSVLREGANNKRIRESLPPASCPHDGEQLISDGQGGLKCRFDGWWWPQDGGAIR
jgi:hypothetical protein